MEIICLESVWRENLTRRNWPSRAILQFPLSWAPSTLTGYNNCIKKLVHFCQLKNYVFPPTTSDVIVEFLCYCADGTNRPQSVLNITQAALGHLYAAFDMDNALSEPPVSV